MHPGENARFRRGAIRLAGRQPGTSGPALVAAVGFGLAFVALHAAPGLAADRAADPGKSNAGRHAFRQGIGIARPAVPKRHKPQVRTVLVAGAGVAFLIENAGDLHTFIFSPAVLANFFAMLFGRSPQQR